MPGHWHPSNSNPLNWPINWTINFLGLFFRSTSQAKENGRMHITNFYKQPSLLAYRTMDALLQCIKINIIDFWFISWEEDHLERLHRVFQKSLTVIHLDQINIPNMIPPNPGLRLPK